MYQSYWLVKRETPTMNRLWKSERRRSCLKHTSVACPRAQKNDGVPYVDKLLLSLVFRPTGLVLEYHVIVPSTSYVSSEDYYSLPQYYLRLTLKSFVGLSNGLPDAMSCSRSSASRAAFSRSCTRPHQLCLSGSLNR